MTASEGTLPAVLRRRSVETPDQAAFFFEGEPYPCAALWRDVERAAHVFRQHGVGAGDHVVVVLPNGAHFFRAFYGVQRAGAIAVPLDPRSGPARTQHLAAHSRARAVVVARERSTDQLAAALGPDTALLRPHDLAAEVRQGELPLPAPDDPAYIQYTSGSTGAPKGVILSHANILTNIRLMIAGMEITPRDVFVSWLPVHHDMGLVLKAITPLVVGARTYLYPASLGDVRRWLRQIGALGASFTAAPDFAYRLALRVASRRQEYDLTSLRVALNASEPVRSATLRAFHDTFDLQRTMVAGYGLAEATVGVSMWPPGSENAVDDDGFVSVGPPFPGVEVRIVEQGRAQAAGEVGEIRVRSAANTRGYLDDSEATHELFDDRGYLRSGDLGYLDPDGNLYVVGRRKNIIKLAGRTLYPREVEELVDSLAGVRLSAAVGVERGGWEGEQLHLFAELRRPGAADQEQLHELAVAIAAVVHEHLGLRPARAYLLQPKAVPRTATGKIQHSALREAYRSGSLEREGAILYPDF